MRGKFTRLLFWRWEFWKDPKWQITSVMSAVLWLVGTLIVYKEANRVSNGVFVIIAVGLTMDMVAWVVGKIWIWSGHEVRSQVSAVRNIAVWFIFFLINGAVMLILKHKGASTMDIRMVMVVYGIAINPVRFRINKVLVFDPRKLREINTWVPHPVTIWRSY